MNKARTELGLATTKEKRLDLLDKLEQSEEEWKPSDAPAVEPP